MVFVFLLIGTVPDNLPHRTAYLDTDCCQLRNCTEQIIRRIIGYLRKLNLPVGLSSVAQAFNGSQTRSESRMHLIGDDMHAPASPDDAAVFYRIAAMGIRWSAGTDRADAADRITDAAPLVGSCVPGIRDRAGGRAVCQFLCTTCNTCWTGRGLFH